MIEQGTPIWFAQRLGKATASRVADIIAKTKSGPSASRENYATQLVLERITNTKGESYTSPAMEWGTATEPLARQAYELKRGLFVDETGFIDHPTIAMTGASPDGLVGSEGLVEIKCPNSATHLDTLITRKIPTKYVPQMMWQMICTGRKWCDFVSFDPRFTPNLQIFVERLEFDSVYGKMLELEVVKFLEEVEQKVKILEQMQ